ncbi:metal ABC transporter substrate-binding protein [Fulvimarina endophytica]|uniref:Metal ABC transporter substrate-binding protein n=1 Tax=Fulvimarina endophytica TaxID=2293836 RepID=A0A371WYI7_9HYPH|nr:zinc ABC transporter substrate-binding protein [Fulvimarina endophytica]RFC62019.1 metal ABC transporter substrate-binding protein [Fulvimarina endophytica]
MLKPNTLAAASVLALTAATFSQASAAELNAVATFSIIGDFAEKVGGDRLDLTTLVGRNGDAHVYAPKPADARALAAADVVLTNGFGLEGFLDRLIAASGTEAAIVRLTDGIEPREEAGGGHYHFVDGEAIFHAGGVNAHAWQSVANAKIYVSNIRDAFCEADPEGCETYAANAGDYLAELTALDTKVRTAVEALPKDSRTVVVGHDAFGYFEGEYGIRFLSPQGISTEAEASAADVAGLIWQMQEARTAAVFAENIADSRLVEQIASEAGTELAGTLYSDALSEPDGPASDYLSMMHHNLRLITSALSSD